VPTLTDHRLSPAGAFNPAFVTRIGSLRQAFDPSFVLASRVGGAYQRQNGCALRHRSSTFRRRGIQPVPRRVTCHRACDNQPTRGKQHTPPRKIPQPVRPPSAPGEARSSIKTVPRRKGPRQERSDTYGPSILLSPTITPGHVGVITVLGRGGFPHPWWPPVCHRGRASRSTRHPGR